MGFEVCGLICNRCRAGYRAYNATPEKESIHDPIYFHLRPGLVIDPHDDQRWAWKAVREIAKNGNPYGIMAGGDERFVWCRASQIRGYVLDRMHRSTRRQTRETCGEFVAELWREDKGKR